MLYCWRVLVSHSSVAAMAYRSTREKEKRDCIFLTMSLEEFLARLVFSYSRAGPSCSASNIDAFCKRVNSQGFKRKFICAVIHYSCLVYCMIALYKT